MTDIDLIKTIPITDRIMREAWVQAQLSEWHKEVLDRQRGYPGDSTQIARYFSECGKYWAGIMRRRGYDESKGDAWCGVFPGSRGQHLGDYLGKALVELGHLEEGDPAAQVCYDLALHPGISHFVMPGTPRLGGKNFWRRASDRFDDPDLLNHYMRGTELSAEDVERGMILSFKTGNSTKSYGSHITTALGPVRVNSDGKECIDTIEGNGWGRTPNRDWAEGVVIRDGDSARLVEDLRRIYPFGLDHCVGHIAETREIILDLYGVPLYSKTLKEGEEDVD